MQTPDRRAEGLAIEVVLTKLLTSLTGLVAVFTTGWLQIDLAVAFPVSSPVTQ